LRHQGAKVARTVTFMEESAMQSTLIAVDLAKNVFEIAVSRKPGKVAERHRLTRARFLEFFAERQSAVVLLEATGTAHHWGRRLRELGHQPVLLPPRAVKRYRDGNKTDRSDTKSLLEASRNDEIRPVPIKSVAQQTLTSLHRLRSSWMATRTARLNTVRGLLRELGLTIPVGAHKVVPAVIALVADHASAIPVALRAILNEACEEIGELEKRIKSTERQLDTLGKDLSAVGYLRSIPGIGLLTATALYAFIGEVRRFPTARHFASYLGLTPREHSSGNVRRLGRISKRGDAYLRTLLTHGGRAVLRAAHLAKSPTRLHRWALDVQQRRGHNVAAIALANKLARIAWAVWRQERCFTVNATN
jgi:transposase